MENRLLHLAIPQAQEFTADTFHSMASSVVEMFSSYSKPEAQARESFALDIAIQRVLEAIAAEKQWILLTLATGTGKTIIAFQIAWKLFQCRLESELRTGPPAARRSACRDRHGRERRCS